ncbi:MAG: DNA polymerase II [Thermoproteus sp.]
MELKYWLLDITYSVVGGTPEIRMFGITDGGERVVVIDRSFKPYFYVRTDSPNLKQVLIKAAPVESIEAVERKYFGRPIALFRVTAKIPEDVRRLREAALSLKGTEVYEADIRFYMRYMIDTGVTPSTWHVVEVSEEGKIGKYRKYLAKRPPEPLAEKSGVLPDLRILAFDIEVYNERGTADPTRDPVIVISLKDSSGKTTAIAANDKDDRNAIREFINYVNEYDPDVILGYNSNGFDWPYLVERSRRLGITLGVDRLGGVPQQSVYGHWSVLGRANVDLFNLIDEIQEIKVKTLDRAAEYFGVMRRDERTLIPGHRIYEYWDDPSRRPLLIKYAIEDAVSTFGLGEKLLPYLIQLSSVSGVPLDQVAAASVGARVEWLLMRYAYRMGEIAPNREERPYETYRGAIVLEPRPGIYQDVAVLDFTSMYPNIMMKYNLSPDTYLEPDEPDPPEGAYRAPEVGHRFRKAPTGFIPQVLASLVRLRREVKKTMSGLDPNSVEYKLLDERQRALKVLANAMYGYMGWMGARWYKREVAESVTAFARNILMDVINYAKSIGMNVIYGDTDSLFVKYSPNIDKIIEYVDNKYNIEIKLEKIYKKILFTESKKRYAGLLDDGRIDIVGFEVVRGDWCELAKEVQLNVIGQVLNSQNINEARNKIINYIKSIIDKIKKYNIDIDDLIIWKTLDKELGEYKVIPPHVYAARLLEKHGFKVHKGTTIGYVIVKGGEKLSLRAKPYILVEDIKEIDIDYYIEKQIVPAALRIAEVIGVKESDLLTGRGGKSLLDFLN